MGKLFFSKLGWAAALATAAALAITGSALASFGVDNQGTPAPDRPQILKAAMLYSEAVKQVGKSAVARSAGVDSVEQANALIADETAWVDTTGALYFIEPSLPEELRDRPEVESAEQILAEASQFVGATISTNDAFALNSKPGSLRTIFIDFDGITLSGTAWNGAFGLPEVKDVPAFDIDGDTSTFSIEERTRVISIWQRVAEDFSMFDVNVTTADPGRAAIERSDYGDQTYGSRAVVTSLTDTIAANCSCGGIAYVGTFDQIGTTTYGHEYYQPAWAFQQGVGGSAKNLAEVVSHEVGHNLGLSHDGLTDAAAGGAQGYFTGHGNWAPIMGVGYYKPVVQWSAGEYAYANNAEDDFAVMKTNGVSAIVDDYGDSIGTATLLSPGAISRDGQITTRTDVDVFKITTIGGLLDVAASVASSSPNLNVELQLRDSSGNLMQSSNPAIAYVDSDRVSGLSATLTTTLTSGTYYLMLDGVGEESALASGFSDYASLGNYSLSGTVPDPVPPTITSVTPTEAVVGETVTVTGEGFDTATAVSLNGTDATFTVQSPTVITFTVPVGASSGTVSVTNPAGTATSSGAVAVYLGRLTFNLALQNQTSANYRVGDLLVANVTSLTPVDSQLQYQWLRAGSAIDGATSATYRLTTADLGLKLSVRVTASKPGYLGANQTSSETVAVSGGTFTAPSEVVIEGVFEVGETLSAAFDAVPIPLPTAVTYTWVNVQTLQTLYSGPLNTYQLTNSQAGATIRVSASLARAYYDELSLTSATSAMVTGGTLASTPTPTISGSVTVGSTLTAVTGSWDAGVSFTYQWLRDGSVIDGATSATYLIGNSSAGTKLSVVVTGSKPGFVDVSKSSSQTALVTGGTLASTPTPTISGSVTVGSTLTAVTGSWDAGVSFSYQWLRDGSVIDGATSATYLIGNSSAGSKLRVVVTGSKPGFVDVSKSSSQTTLVTGGTINSTALTIAGIATFGQTLTVETANWDVSDVTVSYQWLRDGADISGAQTASYQLGVSDIGRKISVRAVASKAGFNNSSAVSAQSSTVIEALQTGGSITRLEEFNVGESDSVTLTAPDAGGTPSCAWRSGATLLSTSCSSILLTNAMLGQPLDFEVIYKQNGYEDYVLSSFGTAPVINGVLSATVSLDTANAYVGGTLSLTDINWDDATPIITWWRDGEEITAAKDQQSYQAVAEDVGRNVSVRISLTRTFYLEKEFELSAVIGEAMQTTGSITVSGTARVGQTLTANPTDFSIAGTALAFQWLADGAPVAEATNSTLQLTSTLIGKRLAVKVTSQVAGYQDRVVTSASSLPVSGGQNTAGTAAITGTAKVGKTLKVKLALWAPNTSFTYQWLRSGKVISKATKSSYKLTTADRGKKISLRVTAVATYYDSRTIKSAPTSAVK